MMRFLYVFFFQAEDGIRDAHWGLEFRRVLFRSDRFHRAAAAGAVDQADERQAPRVRHRLDMHHLVAEIGRASCRERVCQYVSISVVAVSLKTNTQTLLYRGTALLRPTTSCASPTTYNVVHLLTLLCQLVLV